MITSYFPKGSKLPAGAVLVREINETYSQGGLYRYAVGTTLSLSEPYYGDGEYGYAAMYWDGEKPVTTVYGDTRGGWDGAGATVDATPDVRAAYAAYLKALERKQRAGSLRAYRQEVRETAQKAMVPYPLILKWFKTLGEGERQTYRYVLTTSFRNAMMQSFRTQVVAWLMAPTRTYKTPLSPKQYSLASQRREQATGPRRYSYRGWGR